MRSDGISAFWPLGPCQRDAAQEWFVPFEIVPAIALVTRASDARRENRSEIRRFTFTHLAWRKSSARVRIQSNSAQLVCILFSDNSSHTAEEPELDHKNHW